MVPRLCVCRAADDDDDDDDDSGADEPLLSKAAGEQSSQRPAGTPNAPVASLGKQTPLSKQEESSLQARIPLCTLEQNSTVHPLPINM